MNWIDNTIRTVSYANSGERLHIVERWVHFLFSSVEMYLQLKWVNAEYSMRLSIQFKPIATTIESIGFCAIQIDAIQPNSEEAKPCLTACRFGGLCCLSVVYSLVSHGSIRVINMPKWMTCLRIKHSTSLWLFFALLQAVRLTRIAAVLHHNN